MRVSFIISEIIPETKLSFQRMVSAGANDVLHILKMNVPVVMSWSRMHGHALTGPFEIVCVVTECALYNMGWIAV